MSEESKEIIVREEKLPTLGTGSYLPMGEEAKMLSQWAKYVATSPYYKNMGGEAAIVSIWLTARELGIPIMSALNGNVYFVQGKIMLAASCMSMLIRKAGHSIQKIVHSDEVCQLRGKRKDNSDTAESIFTIQHAKKAGLVKAGGIWEKYPARMLFNRCLSNLAKDLFSDCIGSAYVEGEIIEDADFEMVKKEPEKIDKETQKFIDDFNLSDINSDGSRFIASIESSLNQDRDLTIKQCSRDSVNFQTNLERFIEKTILKEHSMTLEEEVLNKKK